jgi:hypothetical protein
MILITQKWTNFFEELQVITSSKTSCNGKMCKDKWNFLNDNYKKLLYYHESTSHNPSYWEMNLKEKFHLLRQFSEECYNVIKVFQRETNVNIPMHVWDLQGLGDSIYVQSKVGHEEIVLVRPFMCKIYARMMMP